MRLLIAEDELDLAEALTVFFEKNQFSVDAVHDGFDAYEYAMAAEYDAIILDVMMPKLSDAVRETAESFRDFAESNGHALRLEIAPELAFSGDEYAIRQLVSILLDNAVKYAAEGTEIAFSLEKTKKGVLLSSANVSRTPVAPEKLDKLFDRFYRADPARSGTGGFGIGLSIARSIAEGHKGGIRASLEDGKICFRAELRNMK